MFAKLEALEDKATVGHTTYQFRQAIVEARDRHAKYVAFPKTDFKSVVDTIEGKRKETLKSMKQIGKATSRVRTTNIGAQQGAARRKLEILKSECEKNRVTEEEEEEEQFCTKLVYQVVRPNGHWSTAMNY